MDFESGKGLLTVGLLLILFLGLFPPAALAGYVLALAGLKTVATWLGRGDIYRNFLYAFILYLVSISILAAAFTASMPKAGEFEKEFAMWGPAAAVFLTTWALGVGSAYFTKRAYNALGEAAAVSAFKTAARLVWIGAITAIVFIGAVIFFIGLAFAVAGALALRRPA
ncbi:MAG: DUF996 domain-containing protein [Pyrobaculum sp.]